MTINQGKWTIWQTLTTGEIRPAKTRKHTQSYLSVVTNHLPYLFVHSVLVNGPDCGDMGAEQLGQTNLLITGSGADEPCLPHSVVSYQNTLDQLSAGLFILHPNNDKINQQN